MRVRKHGAQRRAVSESNPLGRRAIAVTDEAGVRVWGRGSGGKGAIAGARALTFCFLRKCAAS